MEMAGISSICCLKLKSMIFERVHRYIFCRWYLPVSYISFEYPFNCSVSLRLFFTVVNLSILTWRRMAISVLGFPTGYFYGVFPHNAHSIVHTLLCDPDPDYTGFVKFITSIMKYFLLYIMEIVPQGKQLHHIDQVVCELLLFGSIWAWLIH